jgi:hypothetical protein
MTLSRTLRLWPITLIGLAACQAAPSGPSVTFTAPRAEALAGDATFPYAAQPIVVTITNTVRTGPSVVTYDVEVATSDSFAAPLVTLTGVPEGPAGATPVTLPPLPGNQRYYWRSRAVVTGTAGAFSPAQSFLIRPQVQLQAPTVMVPANQEPVFTGRPRLLVRNVGRTGDTGTLLYEFQISSSSSFSSVLAHGVVAEQAGDTVWTPTVDLPLGVFYWRARASDPASATVGPFSATAAVDRRPDTGDQIDLSTVTVVLGPGNIASWPVGARVTNAYANSGEVCVDHPGLSTWPSTIFFDDPAELVQGNQWMFAFIGGRWYGGSARWFRPGQACKGISNDPFAGTFYMDAAEPLRSYVPRPGDTIGLMSSTPNRFYPSMRTSDQRTNVVLVRFGG